MFCTLNIQEWCIKWMPDGIFKIGILDILLIDLVPEVAVSLLGDSTQFRF